MEAPILNRSTYTPPNQARELSRNSHTSSRTGAGDEVTLRPELTPSLAAYDRTETGPNWPFPARCGSFGPFWRYEKMQKGRSRGIFQWNIDMLGVNSPEADAELVAHCRRFPQGRLDSRPPRRASTSITGASWMPNSTAGHPG